SHCGDCLAHAPGVARGRLLTKRGAIETEGIDMQTNIRPLALVTGASSGIGYELAKKCAEHGFDLVVVADEPEILDAAGALRLFGVQAQPVQADLATLEGVDQVMNVIGGMNRGVDALLANAGIGLGKG